MQFLTLIKLCSLLKSWQLDISYVSRVTWPSQKK